MQKGKIIGGIVAVIIVLFGIYSYLNRANEAEQPLPADSTSSPTEISMAEQLQPPVVSEAPTANDLHKVTVKTNKGDIVFQTYDADAPLAVQNFVNLASSGFYDNVIFHRVIEGFMIQGGDPTGTGRGGPGYRFADELNPNTESYKNGYQRGVVAMANAGPDTNGSQFFIMHQTYPLPNSYTIFGHVISGQETVDLIATTKTAPGDRPVEDIVIASVVVEQL